MVYEAIWEIWGLVPVGDIRLDRGSRPDMEGVRMVGVVHVDIHRMGYIFPRRMNSSRRV